MGRWAVHVAVLLSLALALAANGVLATQLMLAVEPSPKPLTPERVANASKPAIVFIESDYTITVSLPQAKIDDNAIEAALLPRIRSGEITSQSQAVRAADAMVLANPDAFYVVGNTTTDQWHDSVSGSGFFVTEDGYFVTAAHVVTESKKEERDGILAATKDPEWVAGDKTDIQKGWADYGPSDAEVNNLVAFDQRWIAKYLTVDKIDGSFHVASGDEVGAGEQQMSKTGIRASVVSIDPTDTGHDIAVMKADVGRVPALSLAANDPLMGDATYAIGYPFTESMSRSEAASHTFSVTVTVGKIQRMSSRTSSSGTWRVFGTDAQLEHGDSGGPVVDAGGRVMGVMSFIVPDANGHQLPGQGYFVAAAFVRQDLAAAKVVLTSDHDSLTNTYYRALNKGDEARYKVELNMLSSIHARATMDAYISDDIRHAQTEIAAGNDRTPPDLRPYVLPALGSAGGAILLTLLAWLALGLLVYRRPSRPSAEEAAPDADSPAPEAATTVPAD